jgi:hypothetical protein
MNGLLALSSSTAVDCRLADMLVARRGVRSAYPLRCAWVGWQYWEAGQNDEAIDAAWKSLEFGSISPAVLHISGAGHAEKSATNMIIHGMRNPMAGKPRH